MFGMRWLDRFEYKYQRFAVPNLTIVLIFGQVAVYIMQLTAGLDPRIAMLVPGLVLRGEVWRIFSFILLPPQIQSPIFLAFAWYVFWLLGSALESYWGDFKYNIYLLTGWLATVLVAFIIPNAIYTNAFLGGSVFLAFAWLNPDFQMLLFFILPVRIKWLALITWIGYGYLMLVGSWPARLLVLASIANFLLFFGGEVVTRVRLGRRAMAYDAKRFSQSGSKAEPFHKCAACGKTDATHPDEDFRYCPECDGGLGYCQEHIKNHEHVKK